MVDLFGDPVAPPSAPNLDADIALDTQIAGDRFSDEELTPRNNPHLIGHAHIEKDLLERLDANKMPHALILHGPSGIGKATLAYRLARHLFKETEDKGGLFPVETDSENDNASLFVASDNRIFRQVNSGGHPDLFNVECGFDEKKGKIRKSVDIDQIRKIAPFLRMTSNTQDGWRIVIVDDADTMTINAQNSILKILEEPPKKALLILVVHRIGALIPTIRSRCQSIAMTPLNSTDCKDVIHKLSLDQTNEEEELFTEYCEGSPGMFAHIVEEGGTECIQEFLNLFTAYPKFDPKVTHSFADKYGKAGQEKAFNLLRTYMKWILRTLIKCKIKNTKIPFFIAENTGLNTLYNKFSHMELLKIHDDLDDLMRTAQIRALDKRNTLLQMFFLLQD